MLRKVAVSLSFSFLSLVLFAQEMDDNGHNFNSVRPIRRADIMFKRTIWYSIDLREKQNEPFFAVNNEISKIIIDAVRAGVLRPFRNDSLTSRLTRDEFLENLKIPGADEGLSEEDIAMGFGGGDDAFGGDSWGGDSGWGGGGDSKSKDAAADEFFPKQIYLLEIKEDLIFDRKRSRMYHDIQSVKLIIPGDLYPTGIDKELATFSYKELVENVFKDNPQAVWFNPQNTAEHRNLQDAFDLLMQSGRIIKYSNPKDKMIVDMYGDGEQALGKSYEYKYKLVDYESEVWCY
ncbi:MAG: gliding motility protein GldN [Cytophagales bacterium]|nr:gliding motility protein GldN [Cytophagales bacterium]MDW8384686.1 gliding motility protein GldN [Flammeovirgaceae bacterium]